MKKARAAVSCPEIELYIRMPSGLIALDEKSRAVPLPHNPALAGPRITYGPYLKAMADYFSANSFRRLRDLLAKLDPPTPPLGSAKSIALVSEKHGALYSVSSLQVRFSGQDDISTSPGGDRVFSFAVNAAFLHEQRAFLAVEYRLLLNLFRRFHTTGLPRAYLSGRTRLVDGTADLQLDLFVAEWFENHHEFHLSSRGGLDGANQPLRVNVWKPGHSELYLDERRTGELFEAATRILTAYLDPRTFKQIYPWHHAAGDFIVDESQSPVSVRLITARDYRPLLPRGSDTTYKMLGSLHFFINTGIRMRIDRLDGTGELVWASPEILHGVIRGFSEAWKIKERESEDLPGAADIFSFFLTFTYEERLAFTEIAARDGQVEADETEFLERHLPGHVHELSAALEQYMESIDD